MAASDVQKTPDGYDVHVCRGLNAGKGQGRGGSGTMAGDGSCATAGEHGCAGSNECRSQGGCGKGSPFVQENPGQNDCGGHGGCAVPITDNVSSAGSNTGKPVWDLARKLFEGRMTKAGQPFAPAPRP